MTVKVIVLMSVLLWTVQAQDCSIVAKLSRFSQLNVSPLYELYWNVTGSRIYFVVRVETEGWVGFGISPHGRMLDSDVVIGFVDDFTGAANLTDRRTAPNTNVVPTIDAQQDRNLVAGSQDGNFTTLEFYRAIDTGDATGDRVIGQLVNLIWSFRKDDNIDLSHTVRGVESNVSLLPPLFFNDFTSSCGCDSSITCREGRRLDPASCECVCDSPANTCPTGQTYDSSVCGCVCDAEQQCCKGQVFDEDSCSCQCESVLNCSAGYIFDPKYCQCVCEGSISEDIWYNRYRECQRDNNKVFSIFSCGCKCPNYLQCQGKKVVDPNTCRCVCPLSSCANPKVMNENSCKCQCSNVQRCRYGYQWDENECKCQCQERSCHHGQRFNIASCACESMCPHTSTRCSEHFNFDYSTCQCKCSRTCKTNEVLDTRYCQCKKKQKVTRQPTTPNTIPTTSPPSHNNNICPRLHRHSCRSSQTLYGASCRWNGGECHPVRQCCKTKWTSEIISAYCSSISQSNCSDNYYCRLENC